MPYTNLSITSAVAFSQSIVFKPILKILKNCDELFDRDEFSAAPDAGWPDCFNSGVFVFRPSVTTFKVKTYKR
jgi:glycogenin glucosyltransferase